MLAWKRADLGGALSRLWFAFAVAAAAAVLTLYQHDEGPLLAALGMALAAWLVAGALVELAGRLRLFRVSLGKSLGRARHLPRASYGMTIAHLGLGIVVAGITAASAWQQESIQTQRIGETVEVAGYGFTLLDVETGTGPNYQAERATFRLTRDGETIATLFPEKRFYPVEGRQTTEAAIHTNWLADLYAVVGDADGAGGWTTRLYHNPLVPWLWVGVLVMVIGGAVSLTDRRHRVGAPARARRPGPAAAQPAE